MITQHLLVRGRVQGVGYRQFLHQTALVLGCAGWVRNRVDGTVEAVIHGAEDAVERLLAAARCGPRHSRVDSVEVTAAQDNYTRFEIRPTA
ncbi:MAG: acylphosphatase [Betaproteobacteria bacterium]|nr:acylphosphatase [Betaproteobacteria bacterium]